MNEVEINELGFELLVKVWLEHFMNKPHNLCVDDAGFLLMAHVERARKELEIKK